MFMIHNIPEYMHPTMDEFHNKKVTPTKFSKSVGINILNYILKYQKDSMYAS